MRKRTLTTSIASAGLAAAVLAGCTGTPDTTFGTGGIQTLGIQGESTDVVLPNGKIMVASLNGMQLDTSYVVVRLNPNGSPDPSYGTDGQVTTSTRTAALGSDGRSYFIDSQFRLTAFTAAGKPDTSFGTVTLPFTVDRSSMLTGFLVAKNGDIYISHCVFAAGCTVLRYLPSGQRDTGFVYGGSRNDVAIDAVGPDGGVYVSSEPDPVANAGSLQKLTSSGTVDPTFGKSGRLTLPAHVGLSRIVLDKYNRLTMTVTLGSVDTPSVVRYTARGTADTTFGSHGIAGMPDSPGTFGGLLAIDGLGRIVATSFSNFAPSPLRVYRFTPAGALDRTFGINGESVVEGIRGQQVNSLFTTSLVIDSANRPLFAVAIPSNKGDDGTTSVFRLTS